MCEWHWNLLTCSVASQKCFHPSPASPTQTRLANWRTDRLLSQAALIILYFPSVRFKAPLVYYKDYNCLYPTGCPIILAVMSFNSWSGKDYGTTCIFFSRDLFLYFLNYSWCPFSKSFWIIFLSIWKSPLYLYIYLY